MITVTTSTYDQLDYGNEHTWDATDGLLEINDHRGRPVAAFAPGGWSSVQCNYDEDTGDDSPVESTLYPPERIAAIAQVVYPEAPDTLMPASMRQWLQAIYDAAVGRD